MTRAVLKLERLTMVELVFRLNQRLYRIRARVMDLRPGKGVGLEFGFRDSRIEDSIKALLQAFEEEARKTAP